MAKKYIDADLLRKEIESLKSLEYPCDNSEQNFGFEYALDRLSDSLDSLQQEQSCDTCTNDKGCVTCEDGELWEGKEQPCEGLNDEIKKFIEEYGYERGNDKLLIAIVARHFFELGKTAREEESK